MDPKILDGILTCPGCGGQHLHHVLVDVFARHQEDSETGLHVVVGSVDLIVDQQMTDNPSPRRGGLTVQFSCEDCEVTTLLHVFQHKGSTMLRQLQEDGSQ